MWRQLVKSEILCISCLFHDVCMMILCTRYRIWQNKYYRRVVQDHTMWGQLPKYKPESAINIGLLSFLDIVQGREGENAKRSLREISNYARVTKACSSHHQIVSVLHQNECAVEMLKIFEGKVERCEGSLICSLASDNHCTASSQPSVMLPHVLQMINHTSTTTNRAR